MQSIDQEGKTVEEAIEKALAVLNRAKDEVEYEVLDEGSKGVLGVGARPILVRVRAKEIAEMTNIKTLMNGFLTNLGIDFSNMEVNLNKNDIIRISMDTEDAGILIGKHGQTLEALQYIFNQLMHETKYKVMVDVSNYREKQNNKLIETVKKIASSVRQTRRRITLKPMTAFERRMVHETVKEYTDLTTKSIGVEPERRVVISLLNAPEYDPARENTRPERPYRPNNNRGGYQGQGGGRPQGGGGGYQGQRPQGGGGYQGQNPNPNYQGNRPQGGGGGYQGQNPNPNYQGNRPQGGGGYQGNNYGNANPGNSSGYNSNNPNSGNTGNYDNGNSAGGYKPRSYNNNSQPGSGYNNSGNTNSGYNNNNNYERRNNYSNNNSNQRPYGYKNDNNPNPNGGPNLESNNI